MTRTQRRVDGWVALAVAAAAAVGVSQLQPRLTALETRAKVKDDVYVLPPPRHLRLMTLGHHAMATDILWAKLLVEYGRHILERRPFPHVVRYIDSIIALEPDYAPLYRFLDVLILFKTTPSTPEDALVARRYFERGLAERPGDSDLWRYYGEFLAYVAPSTLTSEDEQAQWRRDGADALARAVDLGAHVKGSLVAAGLMTTAGEQDAAVRHLQRAYALTDDPAMRESIARRLEELQASLIRQAAERTIKGIEDAWQRELPFVSRAMFVIVGPIVDTRRCVGLAAAREAMCSYNWSAHLPEPQTQIR